MGGDIATFIVTYDQCFFNCLIKREKKTKDRRIVAHINWRKIGFDISV